MANVPVTKNMALDGKYELIQLLGWGAHGEVYQAIDIKTQDKVAVKIFFTSRQDAARFVRKELSSISQLTHPNLLPFLAFGSCAWKGEQVEYIVTPYMEGGNLESQLKRSGPLQVTQAIDITLQVVRALWYMHGRSCLHRDVKPANVLLDRQGNVVLADFSISCTPDTPATGPMGTPEYSAPEQMSSREEQHPRIDVYGLGITLYEMLCGTNPFREIQKKQGQAAALQSKYLDYTVPLATECNPLVPEQLARIIQKMIRSNPEERFQNMGEVMRALLPFSSSPSDILDETASTPMPLGKIKPKKSFKEQIALVLEECNKKSKIIILHIWYWIQFGLHLKYYFVQRRSPEQTQKVIDVLWQQASEAKKKNRLL